MPGDDEQLRLAQAAADNLAGDGFTRQADAVRWLASQYVRNEKRLREIAGDVATMAVNGAEGDKP